MGRPAPVELSKTLDVEIDDVGDARIVDRHVGPVGMTRHRYEVELALRPGQRLLEAAVAIG